MQLVDAEFLRSSSESTGLRGHRRKLIPLLYLRILANERKKIYIADHHSPTKQDLLI